MHSSSGASTHSAEVVGSKGHRMQEGRTGTCPGQIEHRHLIEGEHAVGFVEKTVSYCDFRVAAEEVHAVEIPPHHLRLSASLACSCLFEMRSIKHEGRGRHMGTETQDIDTRHKL